jgi:hypothetical protein
MKNSSQINSNLAKANNNLKDNQVNMQTDMDLIQPKDNWDDPPPKPPNSQLGP